MRSEMAHPCSSPERSARKINRSSVPGKTSSRDWLAAIGVDARQQVNAVGVECQQQTLIPRPVPAITTNLSRSLGQREPHLKTGITGFGGDLNISPMLLYNSLHRVQAETCAFSDSFGSEEGFKDVRFYLG